MKFETVERTFIPIVLDIYKKKVKEETFVLIIGANNGESHDFVTDDFFKRDNVSGLLVEPIKHLFDQLSRKYENFQNVLLENSAVYKKNCRRNIFRLKHDKALPFWAGGIGSLNKDTILVHGNQIKSINSHLELEKINCITIQTLIKKHRVKSIDILQIDTEGYDYEIIKSFNFKKLRPKIVIFEHMHITAYQYFSCVEQFEELNYHVYQNCNSFDLMAVDRNLFNKSEIPIINMEKDIPKTNIAV
jgi:FkbM family methyltransferase